MVEGERPDDECNVFLWTELGDGNDDAYDPTTPYLRRRSKRYYRRTSKRPAVSTLGEFILSMEPLRFLEQLREGYFARPIE